GWYLMQTIESYNGRRLDPRQGTFMKWFAPDAFGGTEYENTPVGAVTHVEEPFVTGVNDAGYFGLWTRGRSFGVAAWRSRNTPAFQAVGDPLVGILPRLVVAP
ncbi:MAG TPA: hypothetical protein VMS21_15420, partial [Methylomirabilota bacterium]|nr:hypothetical protein [Methylomirabilota bacterium]